MDNFYRKFLRLGINLAPVGIDTRGENIAYFCTPKGASIIGWAGVDGIHYCRIRGFEDMIFAVSPMNSAPEYVHPIAENFEALLRLLLACGDAAALEQGWQWTEDQFNAYVAESSLAEEAQAVLAEIRERLALSPMETPWQYLHSLQKNFDYSKIKYTEEYYDMDMNPAAEPSAPQWKVFFGGSFWSHQGKCHAGTEIHMGKQLEWAGHRWFVPAAYSCSKGLVVDFCMRVEADEIRTFMKKWNPENDSYEALTQEQQMKMEQDNPLCFHFNPQLELNGRKLRMSHGCSVCFNPCLPEGMINELEAKWVIQHYGLDDAYGWVIWREAFPWESKRRPVIETLSLTMEQTLVAIPGPRFTVNGPEDSFRFTHPVSGVQYTLTVRELEPQTLPENSFGSERWFYPTHFVTMTYTLSPETSEHITVSDCSESDKPFERGAFPMESLTPDARNCASIGIIGGADGPTAIVFGKSVQGKLYTACSALHFESVQHNIEWRITFHGKIFEDVTLVLI